MIKQLPVQFEFQANQSFSTFYSGNNEEVINHLRHVFASDELLIFLWGEAGTGKTHLLQATTQLSHQSNKSSYYYNFVTTDLPDPEMLDGLEAYDLICFDNIERIAENTEWEQAFFNFFNLHRDNNKQLILSAPCPPKFLSIQLPDLKTRMSWGLTLKLNTLTDDQLLNALIYKANDLGFKIPIHVGQFLMTHYARDLPSIWQLLDTFDQETLAAQRKLTIPFLKQIMSNLESNEAG